MKPFKIMALLAAAVIFSIPAFAQKPANFIGVEGGISLPLGNFGNWSTATALTSIQGTVNDPNGYAKAGGFFAVDGAWFFSKNFGIGGLFRYGTYNFNHLDSLSQGYQESFDVDRTSTTVTNYKMWSLMPGIYFDLPLARKFSLTARGLVGIAHASTPQITVAIEDGGVQDPPVVQESASKTAFALDGGVGLRYSILRCLAVNLRADYFYTKPDFTFVNSGRNNNAGREVTEYDQALASANFTLGIAWQFGKFGTKK
ncbi:MAG TPA: outer membrane beta-barrel protein [Puia sp.]|nr:outer membrane beta-barrel protein [Puia sp.]